MKNKAFTLVELLVVIAIIGLLSTIVLISTRGLTDKAKEVRKLSNRRQAIIFCTANPGAQTISAPNKAGVLKNYRVYCDSLGNMWAETLNKNMNTDNEVVAGTGEYWYGAGTFDESNLVSGTTNDFRWSGLEDGTAHNYDILTGTYQTKGKVNDCNEVPDKYLYLFPACNACVGLNYAGFAEGWRLPSQRKASHDIKENCINTEAKDWCPYNKEGQYCAPGRQLWDFGEEQCSNWKPDVCGGTQGECIINFDKNRSSGNYWSSTQYSGTSAWLVVFNSAGVGDCTKSTIHLRVRCFLGQWP